jgi:hypothetical protein
MPPPLPGKLDAGCLLIPKGPEPDAGYTAIPYLPQPGDLLLYDDHNKFHHFACRLVKTDAPVHSGMIVAREDGTPAAFEITGDTVVFARVHILDVMTRMSRYPGSVMVRRIRQPLTPEQSHELTCFAESQLGKRFAVHRILLQASPINCRSGLRKEVFGHTYYNRHRWFCSELVAAACAKINLIDPHQYPANTIYPRDFAYDEMMDLSALYHPPLNWVPEWPLPVGPVVR